MFDWPEQIHTSPIKILFNVTVFTSAALAVMVCGSLFAAEAGIVTDHLPDPLVTAVKSDESQLTLMVMLVAAGALPHIWKGLSRCITMLLCNTLAIESVPVIFTGGGIIGGGVLLSFLQPANISSMHSAKSNPLDLI
jgi:hypothetical protein